MKNYQLLNVNWPIMNDQIVLHWSVISNGLLRSWPKLRSMPLIDPMAELWFVLTIVYHMNGVFQWVVQCWQLKKLNKRQGHNELIVKAFCKTVKSAHSLKVNASPWQSQYLFHPSNINGIGLYGCLWPIYCCPKSTRKCMPHVHWFFQLLRWQGYYCLEIQWQVRASVTT